jgi:hypothetical protein
MIMSMYRARVRTRGGKKALGIFRAQKGALRKKGVSYVNMVMGVLPKSGCGQKGVTYVMAEHVRSQQPFLPYCPVIHR